MKQHVTVVQLLVIFAVVQPASAAPPDIESLAAESLATASRLRGLAADSAVPVEVGTRESIEAYVVGQIKSQNAARQLEMTRAALVAMGCLDPKTDLQAVILKFARDQVAGYYDWERKVMVVATWVPAILLRATLIHEMTHALQDQRFDLSRFIRPLEAFSEPQAAVHALIEGDATLVMLDAMSGGKGGADVDRAASMMQKASKLMSILPGMGDIPPVLQEMLLFPYVEGLGFVAEARRRGGWAAIDAIYKDPPISTEQVLHPAKCLDKARDHPREVRFRLAKGTVGEGWTAKGTESIGEIGLRAVLKRSFPTDIATKAAEGWDGDRYVVLRKGGGKEAIVWASVWDDAKEAVEAEAALGAMERPPVAMERRKDAVVAIWGERPARSRTMIAEVWKTLRFEEIRDVDAYRKMKAVEMGW